MISGEPLPSAFPGADWESVAPETQGVAPAALNEALQLMAAACGPLGVRRAVVVRGGRIIWSGGDENIRAPVYSCTKSFLSACLGLLWDDGRCSPEDLACLLYTSPSPRDS